MSNNITVTLELCQEDRNRLDELITFAGLIAKKVEVTNAPVLMDAEAFKTPSEESTVPQETAKTEVVKEDTPEVVVTAEPEPEVVAPVEEPKPTVTLEQIRQKITVLMAAGGAKKTGARDIVKSYAPNVTGLKEHEDKWPEIWDKLTALEG